MKTIWKFQLEVADEVGLLMPAGAEIVHLAPDAEPGYIWLWAVVDPERERVEHQFAVRGTGHSLDGFEVQDHVGTVLAPLGLVWHVFRR